MTEHPRPHLLIGFDGSDAAGHAIDLAGLLVPGARATVVTVRDTWKPLEHAAWARIGLPDAVLVPAAQTLEQEAAQAAAARAEQGADARCGSRRSSARTPVRPSTPHRSTTCS